MNLDQLTDREYMKAAFEACRIKGDFPEEWEPFTSLDRIDRTISVFEAAIVNIENQLDDDSGVSYSSTDDDWARRARGAKRNYQFEVKKLRDTRDKQYRLAKRDTAAENNARFTEWSRLMHDLLEDLAIKAENAGVDLDGMRLPLNDPASDVHPPTLTEWLDMREQLREQRKDAA